MCTRVQSHRERRGSATRGWLRGARDHGRSPHGLRDPDSALWVGGRGGTLLLRKVIVTFSVDATPPLPVRFHAALTFPTP